MASYCNSKRASFLFFSHMFWYLSFLQFPYSLISCHSRWIQLPLFCDSTGGRNFNPTQLQQQISFQFFWSRIQRIYELRMLKSMVRRKLCLTLHTNQSSIYQVTVKSKSVYLSGRILLFNSPFLFCFVDGMFKSPGYLPLPVENKVTSHAADQPKVLNKSQFLYCRNNSYP